MTGPIGEIPTTPAHSAYFEKLRDFCITNAATLSLDQQALMLAQLIGHISYAMPKEWQKSTIKVVCSNVLIGYGQAILQATPVNTEHPN